MNTVQQDEANLDALAREVASEKDFISRMTKGRDEAIERGDQKHVDWAEKEIEHHKEVLKAAQNILAEESGVAAPRGRRGRPPLQKRG